MKPCFMTEVQKIKQEILREIKSKIDGFNRRYNEVVEKLGVLDDHIVHAKEVIDGIHEHNDTALRAAEAAQESAQAASVAASIAENGKAAVDAQAEIQKQAIAANAAALNAAIDANANEERASIAATGAAQNAAIGAKGQATLDSIPADYQTLAKVFLLKADGIRNNSAKAAAHELHAQDAPLAVTLYGQTTETGTGDKSPNNPYVISGVDAAKIQTSGKNLHDMSFMEFNDSEYVHAFYNTNSLALDFFEKLKMLSCETLTYSAVTTGTPSGQAIGHFRVYGAGDELLVMMTPGNPVTIPDLTGKVFNVLYVYGSTNGTSMSKAQLELGSTATAYEPYNANVITPPLLPDGAPLHGNGTVDDSIENDVLSWCDKMIVLDGSQFIAQFNAASWKNCVAFMTDKTPGVYKGTEHVYGDYVPNGVFGGDIYSKEYVCANPGSDGYLYASLSFERLGIAATTDAATGLAAVKAYLAANPLTVFYRSTEYTPDKDLRVCKAVRNWKTVKLSSLPWEIRTLNAEGLRSYSAAAPSAPFVNTGIISDRFITSAYFNSAKPCIYTELGTNKIWLIVDPTALSSDDVAGLVSYLGDATATYQIKPETYMTDPLPLRKPDGVMPVTVTGSGETAVEYIHDTKHYIDEKFDALAAALLS